MELTEWIQIIVAVVVATISSTGFWKYVESKSAKRSMTESLLMGIAHERIVTVGLSYISRGWITKDEYEDFVKYLYIPYKSFGGNGLTTRIFKDLDDLPILGKAPDKDNNGRQDSIPAA